MIKKKHHYGEILEVIVLKLTEMRRSWEDYSDNEIQKDKLDLLINLGNQLLNQLEEEEKSGSHLRSKEYKDLNNKFFDSLKILNLDLYS